MHCPAFLANNNIWVSLIVGGLANGFLYALIALGYTLVYGVLRLINFAHSEVMMAGGFGGLFAMRAVLGTSTPGGDLAIGIIIIGIVAGACAGGAPPGANDAPGCGWAEELCLLKQSRGTATTTTAVLGSHTSKNRGKI